tara:strand:+ start:1065 stop:2186 length:1122 start_codon:yes stop_codon:yes gene_type:complete
MMNSCKRLTGIVVALASVAVALGDDFRQSEWAIPGPEYQLTFPYDHGSHPDFKIEWWYLTGHLFSGERRFGFQATFFRLGQDPGARDEGAAFGSSQIYMAHMGLSDVESGIFLHEERLNREGWDAGSEIGDLKVHNGNWTLSRDDEKIQLRGSVLSEVTFDLMLEPSKGPVVFGEDGISRKGPEGTASSYYITFPRLEVSGQVEIGEELVQVSGQAWMDHEISSSQLDRNQVGWDWACLQLFDGREIMGYVLRSDDGQPSEYSRLVWIDPEGKLTHLTLDDYEWVHEGSWKSEKTGAVYPISPLIQVTDPASGEKVRLRLNPVLPNQEIRGRAGGVSYWEGACDIEDESTGEIIGRAFLEMTGYADDIGDKLR